ncbi:galactose-1-epimerase [Hymenobacter amundsenii]|uniref:Aldose 1-epimerase n=1 Tax=Hymenobacter amundsenii TaxID=2006685 RepID=A0A246FJK6_9BACT|nr:aldose epimerase family protein [Hymenobacter amundsenii]OWP62754.1 galactose-1-epimerase [Hymenobacter amundsenii]
MSYPSAKPAGSPSATAFGQTANGETAQLYTLANAQGLLVRISDYGGTITELLAPDRQGELGNVVLGFESLAGYQSPAFRAAGPYFGALIGRYANRIGGGQFRLGGRRYELATNDHGNALHGGLRGFDKVMWQAEPGVSPAGPTLTLRYQSPDGEEGYPGTLDVRVVYMLTADNTLRIEYTATTDQATPLNLTNHSYFNLSAGRAPDVLGHELQLAADAYTVVGPDQLPTGELRPVAGTPFDFREPHAIGARLGQVPGGYDHNWVLRGAGMRAVASVYEPSSGRTLQVQTTQPGIQFYSGNFLDGSLTSPTGQPYVQHAGLCLETQHFPDSPNQPTFPNTILEPGQTFQSTTEYHFGVRL